jgi:heat shock protein HslJ
MKKLFFLSVALISLLAACKTSKPATASDKPVDPAKLNGTWELNYITTSRMPFKDLYPDKKPTITFEAADKKVNGNTGCNTFIGVYAASGNTIDLTSPLALSRMACPGVGETVFLDALKKANTYSISGKTLSLQAEGTETMRFEKK